MLYEAVFELKEAGIKLDVTRWVPRLTQSVTDKVIFSKINQSTSLGEVIREKKFVVKTKGPSGRSSSWPAVRQSLSKWTQDAHFQPIMIPGATTIMSARR